ncbi:UNKNOWN [Stylonychia lemnae]|uniref:Transmembrane protein n=1 Tax=Stylonychia lemnae TaxID=5949 RepID=A0A077ZS04_STYLE|nr:UNKNOWN [Stylonychia lemnae]|eukprot:CDW72264.1 UNKNOWN [Stylonychia lemnae]
MRNIDYVQQNNIDKNNCNDDDASTVFEQRKDSNNHNENNKVKKMKNEIERDISQLGATCTLICRIIGFTLRNLIQFIQAKGMGYFDFRNMSSQSFFFLLRLMFQIKDDYLNLVYSIVATVICAIIFTLHSLMNFERFIKLSIVSVIILIFILGLIIGQTIVLNLKDNKVIDQSITMLKFEEPYNLANQIYRQFDQAFAIAIFTFIILKGIIQGLLMMHISIEQLCILYDELFKGSVSSNTKKITDIVYSDRQLKEDEIKVLNYTEETNERLEDSFYLYLNNFNQNIDQYSNGQEKNQNKKFFVGTKLRESYYLSIKNQKYWMAHVQYQFLCSNLCFLDI